MGGQFAPGAMACLKSNGAKQSRRIPILSSAPASAKRQGIDTSQ
jgi:hypothetical protein